MDNLIKLTSLNPGFVDAGGEGVSDKDGNPVPKREGVGISFDCPCGCGDRTYTPFENPLDGGPSRAGGHPAWQRTGDTFETLTLKPSILRTLGCKWHGYLTNGEFRSV